MLSWVQGFLSGLNIGRVLVQERTVQLPSPEETLARIDGLCKRKSDQAMYRAAMDLYMELMEIAEVRKR